MFVVLENVERVARRRADPLTQPAVRFADSRGRRTGLVLHEVPEHVFAARVSLERTQVLDGIGGRKALVGIRKVPDFCSFLASRGSCPYPRCYHLR
jgi:hypothetical protein